MPITWNDDFIKKLTNEEVRQYKEKLKELRGKHRQFNEQHSEESINSDLKLKQEAQSIIKELITLLCNLGHFYEKTSDTDNNKLKISFHYYEEASQYNDRYAIFKLGFFLMNGIGCVKNATNSICFYERASLLGAATASFNVAYHYDKQNSDLRTQKKALEYYQLALKQNPKLKDADFANAAITRIQERLAIQQLCPSPKASKELSIQQIQVHAQVQSQPQPQLQLKPQRKLGAQNKLLNLSQNGLKNGMKKGLKNEQQSALQNGLQKEQQIDKTISSIQEEEEAEVRPAMDPKDTKKIIEDQNLSSFSRLRLLYSLSIDDYVEEYRLFENGVFRSYYIPSDPLPEIRLGSGFVSESDSSNSNDSGKKPPACIFQSKA